jgi:adenylate cyclase
MLFLTLANEQQRRQIQHERGPVELGRGPEREIPRIIVEDPYTSRDQIRLEELPSGEVMVTNLGGAVSVVGGAKLEQGQARALAPPARLSFGCTTLEIGMIPTDEEPQDSSLQTISRPRPRAAKPAKLTNTEAPSVETLTQWFATLLSVQRAAAGSNEFYGETARAVVELVGLDRGLVLLREASDWKVVATSGADERSAQKFSRRVLNQVRAEKRTVYQNFQNGGDVQSLQGIEAVVASPIFDDVDEVIGVVFGSRDLRTTTTRGIQPLEAQLVQLLAGAVSAGLARVAGEAEAARARIHFEQFFSPELAQALERDAGILAPQERELTVLFADLRGFSRIAERLGAHATFMLLADILDRLTVQIMDHGGVVIDYYGDGVAAMWNAPANQPEHAQLALEAAQAMLEELPALNVEWAERLGGLIRLGIGLNSGVSQVGNAGSKRRMKYGPRGHAVNLASRVEACTKLLGVPCVITEHTRRLLPAEAQLRRLCCARVSGMASAIELFEVAPLNAAPAWRDQREKYEAALALFEQDRAAEAIAACETLGARFGAGDAPTQLLLAHARARVDNPSAEFDATFNLETK